MSLTHTPNANRLHIALFGKRNSGKSSFINAFTGQETALVSDIPGTTTDPVSKAMEIPGIGPCVLIDTPGLDDEGVLGEMRVAKSWETTDRTDIALLFFSAEEANVFPLGEKEWTWGKRLKEKGIPTIPVISKCDLRPDVSLLIETIRQTWGETPICLSATTATGLDEIRKAILAKMPADFGLQDLTGDWAQEGDLVLLVMPQDAQAPKGRLILPQAQTIRELLDKKCLIACCTPEKMPEMLQALSHHPRLIITDSQVFKQVYELKPKESHLTSFSVLFARQKGDIHYYVESVRAINRLTEKSRVLIAEACTHAPATEDIGRVKIPQMLRQRIGEKLTVEVVSGKDFPQDLSPYSLVIHCGGCMFNRKHILSRIESARRQQVPMTNYGIAIAFFKGILDEIEY